MISETGELTDKALTGFFRALISSLDDTINSTDKKLKKLNKYESTMLDILRKYDDIVYDYIDTHTGVLDDFCGDEYLSTHKE